MALAVKVFLGFVVVAIAAWLINPTFSGYHVGYNAATDNVCISHVLQWCTHDPSLTTATSTTP